MVRGTALQFRPAGGMSDRASNVSVASTDLAIAVEFTKSITAVHSSSDAYQAMDRAPHLTGRPAAEVCTERTNSSTVTMYGSLLRTTTSGHRVADRAPNTATTQATRSMLLEDLRLRAMPWIRYA